MLRGILSLGLGRTTLMLLALSAITATTLAGDLRPTKGGKASKSQTKVTASADKPGSGGVQKVVVLLEVNPGWYAYANPVANADLEPVATVITVRAKGKLENLKIAYPAGKLKKDLGETYRIYEGKTAIPFSVQRAQGDASPLEISVRFMTCNGKECLDIEQVKVTLP